VALNDLLAPYMRRMGLQVPTLPGQITTNDLDKKNVQLTNRKYELERYLSEMMVVLADRTPLPLYTFLNFHGQGQIEFTQTETLKKMTSINFDTVEVAIPRNQILVGTQGTAKINYVLEMQYRAHEFTMEEPLLLG